MFPRVWLILWNASSVRFFLFIIYRLLRLDYGLQFYLTLAFWIRLKDLILQNVRLFLICKTFEKRDYKAVVLL
jgi:hypothetical protein